jgi:hypothetical protein
MADLFEEVWATMGGDAPLTGPEATRAVRRLMRFALGTPEFGSLVLRSKGGNTYKCGAAYTDSGMGWYVYINPKMGWRDLVQVMAQYTSEAYYREAHTPRGAFDRMRMRMTREVIKRGWLGGVLADAPKPKPTLDDRRQARLKRIDVLVANWQRKQKRAATAIRKLQQERKRIERRLAS